MTNLFSILRSKAPEKRFGMDDYAAQLAAAAAGMYPGMGGVSAYAREEKIENDFVGYTNGAFKRNGVVFTAMLRRMMLFSEARFCLQDMNDGRPGNLSGGDALRLLENPWPNGTTGELLSRMIQDVDLAGNAYVVREAGRLRRLRPDWVDIILSAAPATAVASDVLGYVYHPGGVGAGAEGVLFTVDEVAHWCPIPDPTAQYRGMSWLSPIVEEIQSDKAATEHKKKFFDNGASLQTVLTLPDTLTDEQHQTWIRKFRAAHQGVRNAYEPLFLGAGADAKVVGADMRQLDFKATQGAGETRIAAASGIGAVILGLSEGLAGSSLNAGNFSAARRLVADGTLRPLWRSACAALASIIKVPSGKRLWIDDRDIAFLREDTKDLADIQSTEGQTIRTLIDGGFKPESIKAAVIAQDWSLLEHTGTFSVQLQPPGTTADGEPKGDAPVEDAPATEPAPAGDAPAKPTTAAAKQRDVAETIQKVYLGVGKVITADEAREIANKAGAELTIPGPFQESDEPEPAPAFGTPPDPDDEPPTVEDEPTDDAAADDEEEQS